MSHNLKPMREVAMQLHGKELSDKVRPVHSRVGERVRKPIRLHQNAQGENKREA